MDISAFPASILNNRQRTFLSMSASVPVFELIQSLTRDEVNNFLRYAKVKGDARKKKYLQLFQLIRGQDRYDETRIRAVFQGQKILNQLSAAKNYRMS